MSDNEKDNSQNKSNININSINDTTNNKNNSNIINQNSKASSNNSFHSRSNSSKGSKDQSYSSPLSSNSSKSKSKYSRSSSKSYSYSSSSYSYSRHRRRKSKGIPQVFVTKLSSRVTKRDLEREFERFGRIRNLNLKRGYAFIEYYNKEDAKYAIRELDNKKLFGQQQRIVVEEAKGRKRERERERERDRRRYHTKNRSRSRSRDRDRDYYYSRRSGPKKTDICFNCGREGHWANECTYPRKER